MGRLGGGYCWREVVTLELSATESRGLRILAFGVFKAGGPLQGLLFRA